MSCECVFRVMGMSVIMTIVLRKEFKLICLNVFSKILIFDNPEKMSEKLCRWFFSKIAD